MGTVLQDKITTCENCGTTLEGEYCHKCGQPVLSSFRFFGSIIMDLLDNFLSYDSRVNRTLIPLIFRPGLVCKQYLDGKRVRFLPPFRLYLFTSVLFFLVIPLVNDITVSDDMNLEMDPETAQELAEAIPEVEKRIEEELEQHSEKLPDEVKEEIRREIENVVVWKDGELQTIQRELDGSGEVDNVNVNVPFFTKEENEALGEKIKNILQTRPNDLIKATLNSLPTMIFIGLPFFCVAIKSFVLL